MRELDIEDLEKRFTYHPPKDDQPERYAIISGLALLFADVINLEVPDSREEDIALTRLDEVVMWANAGIARNE